MRLSHSMLFSSAVGIVFAALDLKGYRYMCAGYYNIPGANGLT